MLRHSTAHLLAEAVSAAPPGVKIAIGPPIADGFYYDFEFPEPISEADLEAIEDEMRREIAEGRSGRARRSRERTRCERFRAEAQPYKVELAEEAEGADLALHAGRLHGPLPRAAPAGRLADQGAQADVPRRRLLARATRRTPQLTRIYGTAFYSQADLDAHLERLEQARARDHRRLGRDLDLFHFDEHSPGSPLWHPKGMVLWNALEDAPPPGERAARLPRR